MNESIRIVSIYGTGQGHLVIFRSGFLEKGQLDPASYILGAEEVQAITDLCTKHAGVELATPQLNIKGLLTNGKESRVFIAQGSVPSTRQILLERLLTFIDAKAETSNARIEGKPLADDQEQGVAVSRGLAELLQLKLGDWAVAFSTTADGQMNALDIEVFQLFNMRSELYDKFMVVPFKFAQNLLDTDGADRVAVLLTETEKTELVRSDLSRILNEHGLDVELKTWDEMSPWYRRVKDMFDTIFNFLFLIVLVIVIMSVVNTMSMAVLERTREIGTMRALGLKRRGVLFLFAVESGLLGIFGNLIGVILTLVGWGLVKFLQPTWRPPGLTRSVILRIELVPETMVWSFLFLAVLFLLASLVTARRAARRNIVDALGHV